MSEHHAIFFVLLAFLCELIGTASGVSSSTLFVPLARLLESVHVTLVLTAALHVLGNSIRTVLYRKNINWSLTIKFGIPSILFTGIGAQYSDLFSEKIYSLVLGIFLILTSLYFLFFNKKIKIQGGWMPLFFGGLSGFLTGLIGSGGAIRALALTTFSLNPLAFTATSTLIDFGGDILRLGIYFEKGYLNPEHYFYIPFLMVVALIANMIARKWLKNISHEKFHKTILVVVFIMGLISIAQSM